MQSVEEIRKNYLNFSDSQVENLAINESKKLRKEILKVLKDEILRRNLNPDLITWVEAENYTISDFEKQSIIKKIEKLSCPNCQQFKSNLQGYELRQIISLIVVYFSTTKHRILCEKCGRRKMLIASTTTLILGWWSAKGFFLTIYSLYKSIINCFNQEKVSKQILNNFVLDNNGHLRLNGTENKILNDLVLLHNNDYLIVQDDITDENIEK